jgi:hypothetical protein
MQPKEGKNGNEISFVTKNKKGGKRKGSGAKPRYNEPTKTIAFRVPISRIEHVKSIIKTLLDGWSVK